MAQQVAVAVIVALAALYAGGRLLFGRQAYAMQGRATVAFAPRPLRGWRAAAATPASASANATKATTAA